MLEESNMGRFLVMFPGGRRGVWLNDDGTKEARDVVKPKVSAEKAELPATDEIKDDEPLVEKKTVKKKKKFSFEK